MRTALGCIVCVKLWRNEGCPFFHLDSKSHRVYAPEVTKDVGDFRNWRSSAPKFGSCKCCRWRTESETMHGLDDQIKHAPAVSRGSLRVGPVLIASRLYHDSRVESPWSNASGVVPEQFMSSATIKWLCCSTAKSNKSDN